MREGRRDCAACGAPPWYQLAMAWGIAGARAAIGGGRLQGAAGAAPKSILGNTALRAAANIIIGLVVVATAV